MKLELQFFLFEQDLNSKFCGNNEQVMEDRARAQLKDIRKEMGNEERKAAVHEELKRMNQLPPNSTYVTHRVRVLNKILQLISLQVCNNEYNYIVSLGLKALLFVV